MQSLDTKIDDSTDQLLLKAIAEELKLPLNRIARLAELGQLTGDGKNLSENLRQIESNSTLAMQLVEGYLISLQLSGKQHALDLEPVSVGSILNDTAHQLSSMANDYHIDLEIYIHGRQRLVMGNVKALRTAFLNIGMALIVLQPPVAKRRTVSLASYPRGDSMIAGIYGNQTSSSNHDWQRAQELYGRARQPIKSLSATNGAGLFVADTIFKAMSTKLRPSHHRNQSGLAANLLLSQQLQLI